jgi:hypothetical protein
MFQGLTAQRLLALFALGWVSLDFPLLALWDRDLAILGLPLLPLAIFGVWALLIAAVAWLVERGGD